LLTKLQKPKQAPSHFNSSQEIARAWDVTRGHLTPLAAGVI